MLMQILAPLYLPVLHLVTLATVPATGLYALLGLLTTPVTIPLLIILQIVRLALFTPLLLLALPVAIPAGGFLAFLGVTFDVLRSIFVTFTPFLWPVCFFIKWWRITCCVAQVMVTDTIMPWLVPLRFTFLAILLPKAILH